MPFVVLAILFVFGLVIGSFINVLALRYDGEHFVFDTKMIGGRSYCPHCKKTLRWYELFPIISFLIQRGRCRNCKAPIGWHYPFIELISGFIFASVPAGMQLWYGASAVQALPAQGGYLLSGLWILAFEVLLLISYIDIRLQIVPDELDIILGGIAVSIAVLAVSYFDIPGFWISHIVGALFGAGFFGAIILFYKYILKKEEPGIGMGDVKLGLPLGLLFGWPYIALLYGVAFVVGSIVGLFFMALKGKTLKSALPFVPFLAGSAAFIFFFGTATITWYFRIIGL